MSAEPQLDRPYQGRQSARRYPFREPRLGRFTASPRPVADARALAVMPLSMAHGLHKRYPKIRVFVTSERQNRYKQSSIDAVPAGDLAFDGTSDILDYRDLLKLYKHYELDRLERIVTILRKHLSSHSSAEMATQHTEALERDVAARFKGALDQGPFPEFNERNLLAPLAQQMLDEYRELLPKSLRNIILLRAARRAAILKHLDDAERFFAAARGLGTGEDAAVEALIAECRGDGDAALRKVRDLRDMESIATTLGILSREQGGDAALNWMRSADIQPQTLTAIAVITLSGIYVRLHKIEQFLELLEKIPAAVFDDCAYLVFLRGILRVVSVLPKPDQIGSLGGIPPVIEVGAPVLASAPLAQRLDAAMQDLQRFIPMGRTLKLAVAVPTAEWFLTWAALLHPHRAVAAKGQLREDMTDFPRALRHRLRGAFDALFTQKTRYQGLNQLLRRLHQNKEELLRVLERPEIPLHTNDSERDVRDYVKKRKVSGGTRSDLGRRCRDTFISLKKTCRKLGISFWDYLNDRITHRGLVAHLPDLVAAAATA